MTRRRGAALIEHWATSIRIDQFGVEYSSEAYTRESSQDHDSI